MKIILILLLFPFYATAQVDNENPIQNQSRKTEAQIPVIYPKNESMSTKEQAAFYLDSVLVSVNMITGLQPEKIEKIKVVKEYDAVSDKYGKVYIELKDSVELNLLSLQDINDLFVKSSMESCIYMIDNDLILDNIDDYRIDKDYILRIEVINAKDFDSLKGDSIDFIIINVLRKTKENMSIILRGKHED